VKEIQTDSPEATQTFAQNWVADLAPGSVIALHGELGAGKTCFVQGLAQGLGVDQPVSSPTYTLVNEYAGRLSLYHLDLYRMHSEQEILDIGFDDYLEGNGITVIEWAERGASLLPPETFHVTLLPGDSESERCIRIEGGPL
jgi:tRNA threonylcarbamoyladenosine biosynthesis protein TsaE